VGSRAGAIQLILHGCSACREPYPAFLTALQYPPDIPLGLTEVFLSLAPTRRRRKADIDNDLPLLEVSAASLIQTQNTLNYKQQSGHSAERVMTARS
jgi:hypothetical protein